MVPEKVRIGQTDYTIHLFPQEQHDNYGVCLNAHQRIYLSRQQGPQQVGNTLLHEIMHAIFQQSGLNSIETPEEESTVNLMATWVHMVLRDNPDVANFIINTEGLWEYGPDGNPDQEALAADE